MNMRTTFIGGFALIFLSISQTVTAAPPALNQARTWTWPLFRSAVPLNPEDAPTGAPVPAVWTSHGEYQHFGEPEGIDVHPGIDIRGAIDDVVVFPASGRMVYASNLDHCLNASLPYCRLWVEADEPEVLYYVGHFDLTDDATSHEHTTALRAAIASAKATSRGHGTADSSSSDAEVTQGNFAGRLTPYVVSGHDLKWEHVHLGVFDPNDGYASLDPLAFLATTARGNDGSAAQTVADDERPIVRSVEVRRADLAPFSGELCSVPEVSGTMKITADIADTYYTRPGPGKPPIPEFQLDEQSPTIGIFGAAYSATRVADGHQEEPVQWYTSPPVCQGQNCGSWKFPFHSSDVSAHALHSGDLDGWISFLEAGSASMRGAPYNMGGDYDDSLFVAAESAADHATLGFKSQVHILSGGVHDSDTSNQHVGWSPSADGLHIVTVEAWDLAGNARSLSQLVAVNNSGSSPDTTGDEWNHVFVKDHDRDEGQLPSTRGDEAFWGSPDIVVVPEGALVDANTPPRGSPLVVDSTYDVYVRVHNSGCNTVSNIRARIFSARPGTMLEDLKCLPAVVDENDPNNPDDDVLETEGDCRSSYQGPLPSLSLESGEVQIFGPFKWTPTEAELDDATQGHRCLVTGIESGYRSGPQLSQVEQWDVPNMSNAAQRNVQTSLLSFWIRNTYAAALSSHVVVTLDPAWPATGEFSLLLQANELEGLPGPDANGNIVLNQVGFSSRFPDTNGWNMHGVSEIPADVFYSLPDDTGPFEVTVSHYLHVNGSDELVGGMTFYLSGASSGVVVR